MNQETEYSEKPKFILVSDSIQLQGNFLKEFNFNVLVSAENRKLVNGVLDVKYSNVNIDFFLITLGTLNQVQRRLQAFAHRNYSPVIES